MPFIGLDHCPYAMVLEQHFNREKANTTNPLEAIAAELTQHNFQHILLVKGATRAANNQDMGNYTSSLDTSCYIEFMVLFNLSYR